VQLGLGVRRVQEEQPERQGCRVPQVCQDFRVLQVRQDCRVLQVPQDCLVRQDCPVLQVPTERTESTLPPSYGGKLNAS
jgi:hypothetical protein